jgi:uncharacterized Ntn-hydrolase superfamily protein
VTFSIVARQSGQFGVAAATSDVAIGARVPWARAGTGAAITQHRTDPRLGPRMLALLASGCDAADAVAATVASTPHADWRQLAVIGPDGPPAAWSGELVDKSRASQILGADHAVVGNVLAGPEVGVAISAAFESSSSESGTSESGTSESGAAALAERLVAALEAGLAAGGERYPLRSAALLVVADQSFPLVDLRVDEHPGPVAELRRLWDLYKPLTADFVLRALDPGAAP